MTTSKSISLTGVERLKSKILTKLLHKNATASLNTVCTHLHIYFWSIRNNDNLSFFFMSMDANFMISITLFILCSPSGRVCICSLQYITELRVILVLHWRLQHNSPSNLLTKWRFMADCLRLDFESGIEKFYLHYNYIIWCLTSICKHTHMYMNTTHEHVHTYRPTKKTSHTCQSLLWLFLNTPTFFFIFKSCVGSTFRRISPTHCSF